MAAAVRGVAATRDQLALLELIEKSDDITWIQAQGVSECLLARRSPFAEQLQRYQVPRAETARLKRDFGSASTDPGKVLDKRKEPLVRLSLGLVWGHAAIVHE
jgi:hypothetical protein